VTDRQLQAKGRNEVSGYKSHTRREREAAALRANLRRRKEQMRARRQDMAPEAIKDTAPDADPDTAPYTVPDRVSSRKVEPHT